MPAGNRPRVPTSLHNELTEYSSLLRALRTSNTLDLASQLRTHASTASASQLDQEDDDDIEPIEEDGESERPESIFPSHGSAEPTAASGSNNSLSKPSKVKGRSIHERDTWTRWPLLAGDVNVPEWSLEDEVKLIATQYLAANGGSEQSAQRGPNADQLSDLEFGADSQLTLHAVNALTESTSRHLSQILALLAAYVPPNELSMQNRVRPLNWESVLNIITANGLADPDSVDSIRQRLSAVYPSSNSVVHNYPAPNAVEVEDLSFLAIDGYDPDIQVPDPKFDVTPTKRRSSRRGVGASRKKRKSG
ncbi:hypothetical protein BDY19DRAFT_993242 [Irpex rosettiformis]|uniref:Uncharacterized protein n=1 Tax=Irpex rosettiformis TaxID=378272 RepID=A0ACB8U638_9APHY|nr:hypothetical protein BDY19DRAFT_993242 [Irpex rosettiformis]